MSQARTTEMIQTYLLLRCENEVVEYLERQCSTPALMTVSPSIGRYIFRSCCCNRSKLKLEDSLLYHASRSATFLKYFTFSIVMPHVSAFRRPSSLAQWVTRALRKYKPIRKARVSCSDHLQQESLPINFVLQAFSCCAVLYIFCYS